MLFDQLVESILLEGSLLNMAEEVNKRVLRGALKAEEALKHLEGILSSIKDEEEKQRVQQIIKNLNKK
jgi:hypothetical protein